MKQLTTLLSILLTTLVASTAPSAGNDHGNGGGVICINGQCKTLIDSGLTVSAEYPDFWIPSEAVLQELTRLIEGYPFTKSIRNKIHQRILLKMTHFKVVEIIDPVKLEAIKNVYIDTIKATSPHFDFTNFQIVAMSSDNTETDQNTFLLPDFLNKLTPLDQAKILIHEGLYRGGASSDLKYILQLESALKIFENVSRSNQPIEIRKNMVSAQISAYNLKILNPGEAFVHIVTSTYSKAANDYTVFDKIIWRDAADVFEITNLDNKKKNMLNIKKDYVLSNSYLDARTSVMLLNLAENIDLNFTSKAGCNFEWSHIQLDSDLSSLLMCDSFLYRYTFAHPENLNLLLPK